MKTVIISTVILIQALLGAALYAQTGTGIDPEVLIERILSVAQKQQAAIHDVSFDAELIEGEQKEDGFKEEVRILKKVYIKYLEDTALYHEDYLAYFKEGVEQSENDRDKEAAARKEKKLKRRMKDISYNMLRPFSAKGRDNYEITYIGATDDRIEGYVCHQFEVTAKVEEENFLNGDYFFDAESFQLVRVDFSPAKLVKKAMFKMNDLKMSILYGPTVEGYWFPKQFDIEGKGKAMFFIGVKFAGTEYYRNSILNSGLPDSLFEVADGR